MAQDASMKGTRTKKKAMAADAVKNTRMRPVIADARMSVRTALTLTKTRHMCMVLAASTIMREKNSTFL